MTVNFVYKIFRPSEWASLKSHGVFYGSEHDKRDGFIHLSTASQLAGTLAKYYTDGQAVILAEILCDDFLDAIKFEPSRDGELFPHLYDVLLRARIKRHWLLQARKDASYELPNLLV